MKILRTVLVEDDDYWIAAFQEQCNKLEVIEIVGIAKNKSDAVQCILQQKPDLVILDIELPKHGEGFEVLEQLGANVNFDIIIATAHAKSDYMMQYGNFNTLLAHSLIQVLFKQEFQAHPDLFATRVNAVVKNRKKLQHRKERAIALKCLRTNINSDGQEKNLLCDWDFNQAQIIKLKEILYLSSDQNYNHIHTFHQKNGLIRGSLSKISVLLEKYHFFRIHKSYLVNLNHLEKATLSNTRKTLGTGGEVHLATSIVLPLARNQRKRFLDRMIELGKMPLIV
ncbi:MAG: LytTR family DNA-binding domain-containing protein [Bacteroidota bacterium]